MLHELSKKFTGDRQQDDILLKKWIWERALMLHNSLPQPLDELECHGGDCEVGKKIKHILGISEVTLAEKLRASKVFLNVESSEVLAQIADEHHKKDK